MNSLHQIASAIQNHIQAGLKGTTNEPFQIEQIKDEILVERNAILKQMELSGKTNTDGMIVSINCIPVDCQDISLCCGIETFDKKLHFKIPKPSSFVADPVKFVGTTDRSQSFRIVRGPTWKNAIYSRYGNRNNTYVWFAPNRQDGFIFNPPNDDIELISVDIIPENVLELENFACCQELLEDDAGLIPNWMVREIIVNISTRFFSNMYRMNYKRNDQTGH